MPLNQKQKSEILSCTRMCPQTYPSELHSCHDVHAAAAPCCLREQLDGYRYSCCVTRNLMRDLHDLILVCFSQLLGLTIVASTVIIVQDCRQGTLSAQSSCEWYLQETAASWPAAASSQPPPQLPLQLLSALPLLLLFLLPAVIQHSKHSG